MPFKYNPKRKLRVRGNRLRERLFGGTAGGVFRGMATLALGSGVARIIGIVAIPVLTRIYSPEDYGALSVFSTLVAILAPLLTLRYVLALPLPHHDGLAMNLMVLSVGLMLVLTMVMSMMLWAFGESLLRIVSMEVLVPYWWLIALGLVGGGVYEVLTMWATRRRAYKPIARTQVFQSAAGSIVKIILGLLAFKPIGLLVGQVVTTGGGISSLTVMFWREFRANLRFVSLTRLKLVAVHYSGFPIYRLPSQFLLVFSTQAPLLFTAALYDAGTTGQFGLAQMALSLPVSLLGRTMSNAFYAEAAKIGRKQPNLIRKMAYGVIKRLFVLSLVPALVLFFFGPTLFSMAFGEVWATAGVLASILSVYLLFQFVQTPVAYIFYIFDGQKPLLFLNIQRTILILLCFGTAYYFSLEISETAFLYSIVLSGHYLFSIIRALNEIPK